MTVQHTPQSRPESPPASRGVKEHPALQRTWWLNLYPDGKCTGTLCETRESALNRCTYTNDKPDAVQVEVRIEPAQHGDAMCNVTTEKT